MTKYLAESSVDVIFFGFLSDVYFIFFHFCSNGQRCPVFGGSMMLNTSVPLGHLELSLGIYKDSTSQYTMHCVRILNHDLYHWPPLYYNNNKGYYYSIGVFNIIEDK